MASGPLTLLALTKSVPDAFKSASGPFAASRSLTSEKFYEFPFEGTDGKLRARRDALQSLRTACKTKLNALFALASERRLTTGIDPIATTNRQLMSLIDALEPLTLPALTGEENTVEVLPRGQVFCAGETASSIIGQAMVASAFGNEIILLRSSISDEMAKVLAGCCRVVDSADAVQVISGEINGVRPRAVLAEQTQANAGLIRETAAQNQIAAVFANAAGHYDWTQVVRERVTTVNASAAGGNTQLMVLSEDAF